MVEGGFEAAAGTFSAKIVQKNGVIQATLSTPKKTVGRFGLLGRYSSIKIGEKSVQSAAFVDGRTIVDNVEGGDMVVTAIQKSEK
jgi:hypothetical protein